MLHRSHPEGAEPLSTRQEERRRHPLLGSLAAHVREWRQVLSVIVRPGSRWRGHTAGRAARLPTGQGRSGGRARWSEEKSRRASDSQGDSQACELQVLLLGSALLVVGPRLRSGSVQLLLWPRELASSNLGANGGGNVVFAHLWEAVIMLSLKERQ